MTETVRLGKGSGKGAERLLEAVIASSMLRVALMAGKRDAGAQASGECVRAGICSCSLNFAGLSRHTSRTARTGIYCQKPEAKPDEKPTIARTVTRDERQPVDSQQTARRVSTL
jgi:hypothetical protein